MPNPLDLTKSCPEHPDSPIDRFRDGAEYCSTCGRPYYEFIQVDLTNLPTHQTPKIYQNWY